MSISGPSASSTICRLRILIKLRICAPSGCDSSLPVKITASSIRPLQPPMNPVSYLGIWINPGRICKTHKPAAVAALAIPASAVMIDR